MTHDGVCANCSGLCPVDHHGRCLACGSDSVVIRGSVPSELARRKMQEERARFLRRGQACDCPERLEK